jgi:plasmid stabilization system protein ParE
MSIQWSLRASQNLKELLEYIESQNPTTAAAIADAVD